MRYFLLFVAYLLFTLPVRAQRDCGSVEYRKEALRNDPGLAGRVSAIEEFTRLRLKSPSVVITGTDPVGQDPRKVVTSLITIPVVVHIVYNNSTQDISDAQVQSQIDVL